jgi:hypothetical protein
MTYTLEYLNMGHRRSNTLMKAPLYSRKCTVWYTVSVIGIVGPVFFANAMLSKCYREVF